MNIENMVHIYYEILFVRKKGSNASKWLELEEIMLYEVSEAQKDKHWVLSIICGF